MPIHGKATSIVLGAYPIHQWFNDMSTAESQDTAETTAFQDQDKTYVIGLSDATVDASGRYEGNVGEIRDIVRQQISTQGESVLTVGWGMGGPKAGNPCEFGRELHTAWGITSPMDGIVSTSLSAQVNDGLAHGKHLLDLVSRTVTTTGPTVQLDAAIPAGMRWAAAFHRTAATGSAVSALKIQTSADGSTGWTDLAGATTTFAATAKGSVLVAGTATTAGAFVRAVETITGTGASTALAAFGLY
jgi:hypothetical protein